MSRLQVRKLRRLPRLSAAVPGSRLPRCPRLVDVPSHGAVVEFAAFWLLASSVSIWSWEQQSPAAVLGPGGCSMVKRALLPPAPPLGHAPSGQSRRFQSLHGFYWLACWVGRKSRNLKILYGNSVFVLPCLRSFPAPSVGVESRGGPGL